MWAVSIVYENLCFPLLIYDYACYALGVIYLQAFNYVLLILLVSNVALQIFGKKRKTLEHSTNITGNKACVSPTQKISILTIASRSLNMNTTN